MKKITILLVSLLTAICSFAQKHVPTTAWPFLYRDFQDGTVFFSDNGRTKGQMLNIHMENVTLWHQDDDKLLLSNPTGISKVVIMEDVFIYMNGELVRLIASEDENVLVESVKLDFKSMVAPSSGAYGMSAQTSATRKLISISDMGYTQHIINDEVKRGKDDGMPLPLIRKYFFIIGEKIISASRKEVEKSVSKESLPALRNILKEKKIKWNDEKSLATLLPALKR